ncbi:MAG TPA: ABC transporter substrate-binding protein [Steroidobacteraceae bacterium]|nr:ABC transporter substrate-binding protein [Steroidobacteraceae bacterium]
MPVPLLSRRKALLLATAALGSRSSANEPRRPMRIGFMSGLGYPELDAAFTDELKKQGLVEGRDLIVDRRFSRPNTDDNQTMGRELANSDVQLIVVTALPAALVVRAANPRMPMVIGTCPGMVANGFAQTMERPGGIYTGIDELPPGVTAKRLSLLRQLAPTMSRVALLSTTPGTVAHDMQLADARSAAEKLGVEVKPYRATSLAEVRTALDAIRVDGMNGLQNFQGGLSLANRQLIVDFAAAHRIPAIYQARLFVSAGGLMAWAPDQSEQLRIAARMTARILAGTRPGDIPVVYPPRYSLMLNVAAARGIGMTFPAELLGQADETVGA